MKTCPNCRSEVRDDAAFCPVCGTTLESIPTLPRPEQTYTPPVYTPPVPMFDPYDHTADFDAGDIAENKLPCMLAYLLSIPGLIIALLMPKASLYRQFHIRQAMKFLIAQTLLVFVGALLFWTFLVPIAAGVMLTVLTVIKAVTFVQVCQGKAKDPAILRSLKFLN